MGKFVSTASLASTEQTPARCAVLVLSCDRYRDLWWGTTTLFTRFWPDCPWPRYLASETVPPRMANFESLGSSQAEMNWSALLIELIDQLDFENILLFLDDFFLTGRADTDGAEALLDEMERLGAAHVRLVPHRQYLVGMKNSSLVGCHHPGMPYRACLQAGFWRKDVLRSLLRDGESPWDFETLASERSLEEQRPFLAAWRNPVPYIDVLERGKWLPRGVRLCRRERIPIDHNDRPAISASDALRRLRCSLVSSAINIIPKGMRVALRSTRLNPQRR